MPASPSQNPWPEQTPRIHPPAPRLAKRRRTLHPTPLEPRGSTSKMARQIVADMQAVGALARKLLCLPFLTSFVLCSYRKDPMRDQLGQ